MYDQVCRHCSDTAAAGDFLVVLLVTPAILMATRRLLLWGVIIDSTGRPESLLELQQLSHEVEVRADDGTRVLHQLVSLHHRQAHVSHYVGDCYRRAARYARLTVHEDAPTRFPCFLWKTKKKIKLDFLYN